MRLKTILLVMLLVPTLSPAATLKIATLAPDGTAWMREMRAAGVRIGEQTDGRVKLKFYPGGVMGDHDTVMRKMRIGQMHGGAFTSGELATRYSDLFLYNTPFLFSGEEEVRYVRERLQPMLDEGLASKGLVNLGTSGGGFVYLFSDHQVVNFEQLSQSKVWTPEGDPISDKAFRLAGVAPVPLSLADVYTALQTGMLDTVLNTTAGAIAFQWHTKMRYMVDFPVAYVLGLLALDKKAFDRLSAGDQDIMRAEFATAFANIDTINQKDVVDAREALTNQGIEIISLNQEEREEWSAIGQQVLDYMKTTDDFELEHLDDLIRLVEEYRQQAAQ